MQRRTWRQVGVRSGQKTAGDGLTRVIEGRAQADKEIWGRERWSEVDLTARAWVRKNEAVRVPFEMTGQKGAKRSR